MDKIDHGKPYWKTLEISIYQTDEDGNKKKIGKYNRDYHSLFDTFVPFKQRKEDGTIKEYALISDKYVRTAVMELPSCKIIAKEEPKSSGFCPTGFKVPFSESEGNGSDGQFGFVSGCVWGDDSSRKVQYLDLSRVDEGIIQRDSRFGYVELPRDVTLKDAVSEDLYFVGKLDFTESNKKLKEEGKTPHNPDIKHYHKDIIEIAVPIQFHAGSGKIHDAWSVTQLLEQHGYEIKEPNGQDE